MCYHPVPMLTSKEIEFFDAEPCPPVKVYQPAGEDERAAIGFRQSENSTIEENAKEVLHLLDLYYNTSF